MTTGKAKGGKARQRQLDRQRRLSAPQFLGSELSQLQVGHLDLEAGALRVVNGKGGKDRELPIVPRLAAILRPYLATTRPALLKDPTNRYVFLRAGNNRGRGRTVVGATWGLMHAGLPVGPKTIFYTIRRLVRDVLHRPGAHPHMLRHSFASRLRENGADSRTFRKRSGIRISPPPPRCTRTSPRAAGGRSWRST